MSRQRSVYLILAVLCLVLAGICVCIALSSLREPSVQQDFPTNISSTTVTTAERTDVVLTTTTTVPYTSPVDFKSLQERNPDIYGWIRIEGTPVDYPIVQSSEDDSFYLDHDSDKRYNINGAIFSEHLYNSTDFSDTLTVLYGHNMKSGEMFGEFQSVYWDREFLLENDDITIYLPDREMHFQIFAALPYSRLHLLHYYHVEKKSAFDLLINDIYSARKLSAVLIEERKPVFGDRIIALSTCLSGDNRYRYLVFGVCKDNT